MNVNDHSLHVQEVGTGQPIILLHSLGTSSALWAQQINDLADRYRLVTIDFRGHGQSEISRTPVTIELLASDVVAVLDRIGIERFVLAGISLGGMVAQVIAARLGERVERLVLMDTSLAPLSRTMWIERAALVRSNGLAPLASDIAARWQNPTSEQSPAARAALESLLATPDEGYAGGCDALALADCTGLAPNITSKTTIAVGALDKATPPALAQDLAGAITGADLVILPDCAHLPMIDRPDLVTDLLERTG
ncbi:alpha/beta fold hydrolase [Rhizobium sp. RU36D]|uniref:alpha/beta fold hydrolase n=1 Tax=Rhizobium sp. RU36D TaxID=1907415 RepID=UPI000A052465|nr:alpha/beta fold hydrolase [Rhizobium sp. RU36D]